MRGLNFCFCFFLLLFIQPYHPNSHINFLPPPFPLLNVPEAMTCGQHMLSCNQNSTTKVFHFPIMMVEHKGNHPRDLSFSCSSSTKYERNWQCCTTRLFSLVPLYWNTFWLSLVTFPWYEKFRLTHFPGAWHVAWYLWGEKQKRPLM